MRRFLSLFALLGFFGEATLLGGQDNPYVSVYTLPDDPNEKVAAIPGIYSYAHGIDGLRIPGTRAGNVVKTSRGRILAMVLTTMDYHGKTIDGIGVYDITDPKHIFGQTISLLDTQMKWSQRLNQGFKFQIQNKERVSVWADPDLLDRTTRDSYYIPIEDLYVWRAEKARHGADPVFLGSRRWLILPALSTGSSIGWAFFDPADLDQPGIRVRPRYFILTGVPSQGSFVQPRYPQPVGDSGYFAIYNSVRGSFEFREGGNRPLARPDWAPRLPPQNPLPEIPPVPELPPDLPDLAAYSDHSIKE